tara:strand:+ start:338 stop:523 length:186 start_codon:yes stop_codon:yes gene_type:complete
MTEKQLTLAEHEDLRTRGLILETEIAIISGDLLVAENVVTKSRRIVGKSNVLNESKRLLKG